MGSEGPYSGEVPLLQGISGLFWGGGLWNQLQQMRKGMLQKRLGGGGVTTLPLETHTTTTPFQASAGGKEWDRRSYKKPRQRVRAVGDQYLREKVVYRGENPGQPQARLPGAHLRAQGKQSWQSGHSTSQLLPKGQGAKVGAIPAGSLSVKASRLGKGSNIQLRAWISRRVCSDEIGIRSSQEANLQAIVTSCESNQGQTQPCNHQQSLQEDTAEPETTAPAEGPRLSLNRGGVGCVGGDPGEAV